MWHIHRYTEVERVYAPGVRLNEAWGISADAAIRLGAGKTTIISKCCVCGKLDTVEVLGDARKH